MSSNHSNQNKQTSEQLVPWYKQFWPWFIIALPASVVIASFYTLWLALSNPDHLVVDEEEYRQIKSELKAQQAAEEDKQAETDGSGP
jgi:hypothetical protein